MTEETSTATESTQVTTETSSEETQQVETQSTEQADTTQSEGKVNDSLAIERSEESETSNDSQPSLDDIVNEALGENGLSDETKELLGEEGMRHIDTLVAGHRAIQEKNSAEIYSRVGGENSYLELQEWGRNNLSDAELDAFNDALFDDNMEISKLAVQGLQARYVATNGKAPERVIEGGGTANAENRPYANREEYIRETMHIDYKRNPEFKAKVDAKRNISGF